MKLPPRAVIGHRTYKVLSWPRLEAKEEGARGSHWAHTGEIKIADDLRPHDTAEVLIHEILHACWRGLPDDVEERCVTTLSENFAQVWADNPEIVRFITHNLRRPDGVKRDALRVKSVLKPLNAVRKTR